MSNPMPGQKAAPPLVLTGIEEGIGLITLNRPHTLNLLTSAMIGALQSELERMGQDKSVRVIVIAANGLGFCAGHDLKQVVDVPEAELTGLLDRCTTMMETVRLSPKPVIAQVQGAAVAAGCQLVASCDLVMASETAVFGTTGIKAGLFCSTPMVPLSRVVPSRRALEMLLTGATISAADAERAGLVNHVTPPKQLAAKTLELARTIAAHSAYALGLGKAAFYEQLGQDMDAAYAVGKAAITRNALAPDGREGMHAFLEKRTPKWES